MPDLGPFEVQAIEAVVRPFLWLSASVFFSSILWFIYKMRALKVRSKGASAEEVAALKAKVSELEIQLANKNFLSVSQF